MQRRMQIYSTLIRFMATKRLKTEKIHFGDVVTNLVITITIMITNMVKINKLKDSPVVVVSGGSGMTAKEAK